MRIRKFPILFVLFGLVLIGCGDESSDNSVAPVGGDAKGAIVQSSTSDRQLLGESSSSIALGESSSSVATDDFVCKVEKTATSYSVVFVDEGNSLKEEGSFNGISYDVVRTTVFANADKARDFCDESKAGSFGVAEDVSCSGNTVVTLNRYDLSTFEGSIATWESLCELMIEDRENEKPSQESSSSMTGESIDFSKFICDVQETATTVVVTQVVPGYGSYKETGTLRGNRIDFVQESYYPDSDMAREMCEDIKAEAASWIDGSVSVNCVGNSITRTDFSETTDIAGYAAEQRMQCEEIKKRFGSGAF